MTDQDVEATEDPDPGPHQGPSPVPPDGLRIREVNHRDWIRLALPIPVEFGVFSLVMFLLILRDRPLAPRPAGPPGSGSGLGFMTYAFLAGLVAWLLTALAVGLFNIPDEDDDTGYEVPRSMFIATLGQSVIINGVLAIMFLPMAFGPSRWMAYSFSVAFLVGGVAMGWLSHITLGRDDELWITPQFRKRIAPDGQGPEEARALVHRMTRHFVILIPITLALFIVLPDNLKMFSGCAFIVAVPFLHKKKAWTPAGFHEFQRSWKRVMTWGAPIGGVLVAVLVPLMVTGPDLWHEYRASRLQLNTPVAVVWPMRGTPISEDDPRCAMYLPDLADTPDATDAARRRLRGSAGIFVPDDATVEIVERTSDGVLLLVREPERDGPYLSLVTPKEFAKGLFGW